MTKEKEKHPRAMSDKDLLAHFGESEATGAYDTHEVVNEAGETVTMGSIRGVKAKAKKK